MAASPGETDTASLKQVKEIQEAISKLLDLQAEKYAEIYTAQSQQVKNILSLYEATKSSVEVADDLFESLEEVVDATSVVGSDAKNLIKFAQKMKEAKKETDAAAEALKEYDKKSKQYLVNGITVASAAVGGLAQGFKNAFALVKGGLGVLQSIAEGLFNVTKAIISIPFNILKSFIDMATSGGGGNELAEAYENLREKFGAAGQAWSKFTTTTSSTVINVSKNLNGFSDTGLSVYRTFGNLAQRIQEVTALAAGMGKQFTLNAKEFNDNGGALLAYQKGLGLSAEQMGAMAVRAKGMNTTISSVANDITKHAMAMAAAFQLDAKVLSQDMGKAMQDMAHFGTLTNKELMESITFANRLGISIDKLTGMMDQFDTFDKAAESSGGLAEQLQINVGAMDMMKSVADGTQLDVLRKAMQASGKDYNKMDYWQQKQFRTLTSLDAETAKLAFSQDSLGVSMSDVKKVGAGAEAKTLTQAEAMHELSGSIKQMTQSGSLESKTFFDRFLEGMQKGVQSSQIFIEIMNKIRRALMIVYEAGFKIGQFLATTEGPIHDFFKSVSALFDPERFQKLANGLVNLVKKFFGPGGDILGNFDTFMDGPGGLKEIFLNFFDSGAPAGMKFLQSVKTMMLLALNIIAKGMQWAMEKLAEIIPKITGFIKNPNLPDDVAGATEAWIKPLLAVFRTFADVLWPVLKDLFLALWEKLKDAMSRPPLSTILDYFGPSLATIIFGQAFVSALFSAFSLAMTQLFLPLAGKFLIAKFAPQLAAKAALASAQTGTALAQAAAPAASALATVPPVSPAAVVGGGATTAATTSAGAGTAGPAAAISKAPPINWANVVKFMLAFAGFILVAIVGVVVAILALRAIDAKPTEITEALAIILAVSVAALAIGGVIFLLSKLPKGAIDKAIPGLIAIGVVIFAMGAVVLAIASFAALISEETAKKMPIVAGVLLDVAKVFIAAGIVVGIATAIGAVIFASGGAAAVVLVPGLLAIGAVIIAIGTSAAWIINKSQELNLKENDIKSLEAFIKTIGVTTDIMKSMGGIIGSIGSMSWYSSGDPVGVLNKLQSMLESLFGSVTPPKGLMGLIVTLVEQGKVLASAGPKAMEATKIIADVLAALGPMMTALKPSDAFFDAMKSTWWTTGEDIKKGLDGLANFAEKMGEGIRNILGAVGSLVKIASGFSEQQLKSAMMIVPLLTVVVQLAESLKPSPLLLQSLTTVTKSLGVDSTGLPPDWADQLSKTVTTMSASVETLVQKMVPSFVTLLEAVGRMHFSESDAKALTAIGPMISGMLAFSVSVMSMTSGEIYKQFMNASTAVDPKALKEKLEAAAGIVPIVIQGLISSMPRIFGILKNLIISFTGTGISPDLIKQGLDTITSVTKVFSILPQIMSAIDSMRKPIEKTEEVFDESTKKNVIKKTSRAQTPTEFINSIEGPLEYMAGVLERLLGVDKDAKEGSILQIINVLNAFGRSSLFKDAKTLGANLKNAIDAITSIVTAVSAIGSVMGTWDTIAKSMITKTKDKQGVETTITPNDASVSSKITAIFSQLAITISTLLGDDNKKYINTILINLSNLGGLITNAKGMAGQIKAAGDFIVTISEVATQLNVIMKMDIPNSATDTKLATNLTSLSNGILKISGKGGFVDAFNTVVSQGALGNIAAAAANMQTYSKSLESMKTQMENVKSSLNTIAPLLEGIDAVTKAINEMKVMKLDAKLAPIAGGAIGGKFTYNVVADPATFKVEFNVIIEAQQVEKAIIQSASSAIKAKMNEVIKTIHDKTTANPIDVKLMP